MNVYDFDKTVYYYDSTIRFYFYCLKKYPRVWLYLPKQAFFGILFGLRIMKKTAFKEKFYSFFKAVDDMDSAVERFWDIEEKNMKKWYLERKDAGDVIISASPEFLVRPMMERLGVKNVIASVVDKRTGAYTGENCYGKEKVLRYRKEFGTEPIDEFYSDSLSDSPLAHIAESAYIIDWDALCEWGEYEKKKN